MELIIKGRKLTVTPSLKEHVERKLEDATKVFDINPMTCDVVLRAEKYKGQTNNAVCEVTLRVRGYVIRVEVAKDDMYAAIDEAAKLCSRRLRKYKTKIVDKRQRGAGKGEPTYVPPVSEAPAEDEAKLVRTKYIEYSRLSEDNALVQAELLGHQFFIYTDDETGDVCVVYRRNVEGYGIIKPKKDEA